MRLARIALLLSLVAPLKASAEQSAKDYFNQGVAHYERGDLDEAIAEYSKALDMGPDFVDIRTRLGNVYREMGMFNAAIAEFEHVKREKPDYLQARIYLGVTLFSIGRRDEAITEWRAVLDQDPDNRSAKLYLRMVKDEENAPASGSALVATPEDVVEE